MPQGYKIPENKFNIRLLYRIQENKIDRNKTVQISGKLAHGLENS